MGVITTRLMYAIILSTVLSKVITKSKARNILEAEAS